MPNSALRPIGSQWLARVSRLLLSAGLLMAFNLSAGAVETAKERCERAANVDAAIEACSSVIQTDSDHHRLAMAYFNRAGWHLKEGRGGRSGGRRPEPGHPLRARFCRFALTKRQGLVEVSASTICVAPRSDFAAALKLPETNSLSAWAHAMARERPGRDRGGGKGGRNPECSATTA